MNPISKVTETFGENLKRLRQEKKYTRKDLAEKIGVAAITLAGYETGIRAPSLEKLISIADFFEISLDSLFGRDDLPDTEFQKKNLEWRFKHAEKLVMLSGLLVETCQRQIVVMFDDAFIDDEFTIYERGTDIGNHKYFSSKTAFVEFVETVEREAVRQNKPFEEIFLKRTDL